MKTNILFVILLAISPFVVCAEDVLLDSLSYQYEHATHFKGFLELPSTSFRYALSDVDDSTALTFVQYGLAQIYFHPGQAKAYAQQLQLFIADHPSLRDYQRTYHDNYSYDPSIPLSTSYLKADLPPASVDDTLTGMDRLLDLVPGAKFLDFLWFMASFLGIMTLLLITVFYVIGKRKGVTYTLFLKYPDGTKFRF